MFIASQLLKGRNGAEDTKHAQVFRGLLKRKSQGEFQQNVGKGSHSEKRNK